MRTLWILILSLVLAACGGGGSSGACDTCSTGSTIPVGSVSGTTFDGLITSGIVTVYDFTAGVKGSQLAQATSDSSGLYSLSLQIETRPILVEVTGGYYAEEAGANPVTVTLEANQKLSAVTNYTTGSTLKVAVTTFTHLAAGLAAYEISKGTAVSTAIDNANSRVSSLAGVNILTTFPKEIADVTNASATLKPELRYGFLEAAISMWTYNNAPNITSAHLAPYTSIDFAQLLYQDISADGLLDGQGLDSTGATTQLSFGTIPLGVDVYRLGLGTSLVQMAASTNNKTGLTGAQVFSFAQSYIANTDAMFNNVAPSPIIVPVVTITSPALAVNAWVKGLVSVVATTQITSGLGSTVELLVDNVSVGTATNLAAPTFTLDTAAYPDGVHTIGVRATDLGGQVTTSSIQLNMDNTPPTSTFAGFWGGSGSNLVPFTGCASDGNGSGILSVTDVLYGTALTRNAQGCWASNHYLWGDQPQTMVNLFIVKDKVGLCSTYRFNFWAATYADTLTLVSSGPC
jgi:hypothetical protein